MTSVSIVKEILNTEKIVQMRLFSAYDRIISYKLNNDLQLEQWSFEQWPPTFEDNYDPDQIPEQSLIDLLT